MKKRNNNNVLDFVKRKGNTRPITDKSVLSNTTNDSSLEYECIEESLYEDEQMKDNSPKNILCENDDLKTNIQILNSKIENTNKIIGIVGTVIGLLVTVLIFGISTTYNAIKDINNSNMSEIKTEIKAINQRLDYQEKLNSLQIERDINKEISKIKNN